MAWDPTVYDDLEFPQGNRVEATQQIHFPGPDGQLREITVSDANADAFWTALEPFIEVARLTGLRVPPVPDKLKVKDFLAPSTKTKTTGKKAASPKNASEPPPPPDDPVDEPFWEIRNLGDGRVVPLNFWRTPEGSSTQVAQKYQEMRREIRDSYGENPSNRGQVKEEPAYRWGREHIEEVLGVGLW